MVFRQLKNNGGGTPSVTGGVYYNDFCPWLLTWSYGEGIRPQMLRERAEHGDVEGEAAG